MSQTLFIITQYITFWWRRRRKKQQQEEGAFLGVKGHTFPSSCVEGQVMKTCLWLTSWLLKLGSRQKGEGMDKKGQCVNKHHFLLFNSQQQILYWNILCCF